MLSEAYTLWRALQESGIAPDQSHPDVKPPGRSGGPCLRVRLGRDGSVVAVQPLADDEWPGLWTKIEGNQNSFPVVRVKEPLLRPRADDPVWSRLGKGAGAKGKAPASAQVREACLDALGRLNVAGPSTGQEALWRRLREEKAPGMGRVAGTVAELAPLLDLTERFVAATAEPACLYAHLAAAARCELVAGASGSLDAFVTLLLGKGPPRGDGTPQPVSVQLAFDTDDVPSTLYSGSTQRAVNRGLLGAGARSGEHPGAGCAFTGETEHLQVRPFPQVRLPVLNRDFPLVAMFSEAGCNRRYGLTDSFVVPVSQAAALGIQDALKWIVAPERQRRTWRAVASGQFETRNGRSTEKRDLLIAYAAEEPDIPTELADMFGTSPEETERQFVSDAAAVCTALQGLLQERPDTRLNLVVIRAVSQGQAQVVHAAAPTAQQVLDGAVWWQAAARNLPLVSLPVWNVREKRMETRSPAVPYPDEVVRALSADWVRNGTHGNAVAGVALGDVLSVMLGLGDRRAAAWHILDLAVRRSAALLVGFAGALRTGRRGDLDMYPLKARVAALQALSVLGIMLMASGREKGEYMRSQAFLVGRFLALADALHREYCRHVRGGDIPPQLIGNAMMPVASGNLQEAVARLCDRMTVYKAWAMKGDGEEYRLAKWCLGQLGDVSRNLSAMPVPTTTTPAERAELLLGYMAKMGEADPASQVEQHQAGGGTTS